MGSTPARTAPLTVDASSRKFEGEAIYKGIRASLPAIQLDQYAELDRRLHIAPEQHRAYGGTIRFRDAADFNDTPNPRFSHTNITSGDVRLMVENAIVGGETHIRHELTHSWMRNYLGPDTTRGMPNWFREGFTIYETDEIDDIVARSLSVTTPDNILASWNPLSDDETDVSANTLFGLTVEFIEKEYGIPNALEKILKAVHDGFDFEEALLAVGKDNYSIETFYAASREYALMRLDCFDADNRIDFIASATEFYAPFYSEIYADKRNPATFLVPIILGWAGDFAPTEGAIGDFEAFLEGYSGTVFASDRNILLGIIDMTRGEFAEAANHFAEEISSGNPYTYTEAHFYYGMALAAGGDAEDMSKAQRAFYHVYEVDHLDRRKRPALDNVYRIECGMPVTWEGWQG